MKAPYFAAPPPATEHYATLFDRRFLLQGLALHESLQRHHPGSVLWVLCLDEVAEEQLERLHLSQLQILPLRALEGPELLQAKRNRGRVDYIFTLTPFIYDFIFREASSARRVTYVDADVYFFRNPARLFREMEQAGRQILITEHGFSPEFGHLTAEFGRFCVQFLPVERTEPSLGVIREWQRQCLESCTIAASHRKLVFGDQKYLDAWPEKYPGIVHICSARPEVLAPWNVDHYQARVGRAYEPIFYHFHSFRIFHRRWVQLCAGFNPRRVSHLYETYLAALARQDERLKACGIPRPFVPFSGDRWWLPRLAWRCAAGRALVRPWSSALSAGLPRP